MIYNVSVTITIVSLSQGFWDMVYFQVEDIYQKFHGLETIEKNGWTLKAPTPKKKKTTKVCFE